MVTDSCLVRFMPRFFAIVNNKKLAVLFYHHNDCYWDVWSVFCNPAWYRNSSHILQIDPVEYYCALGKNGQIRFPRTELNHRVISHYFLTQLYAATSCYKKIELNNTRIHLNDSNKPEPSSRSCVSHISSNSPEEACDVFDLFPAQTMFSTSRT